MQKFGVSKIYLKEINILLKLKNTNFIQLGCIKLIKSDSKHLCLKIFLFQINAVILQLIFVLLMKNKFFTNIYIYIYIF